MAFTNSNDYLTGRAPVIWPSGSEVVAVRYPLQLDVGDLQANDIGAVGILPARCVPVAVLIDSDALDSNASKTIAASIGLLNSGATDISTAAADGGAAWGTGITVCQAGGQVMVLGKALPRVKPNDADRFIGIKFTTGAATAAAGEIGVTLFYKAA